MKTLDYSVYFDKILGGWYGKSIGEVIASQVEGVQEFMDFEEHQIWTEVHPANDDLTMQVMFLEVIEEKGMVLLYGDGDSKKTGILAMNLGYDTDSTATTTLAILGLIYGFKRLPSDWIEKNGPTYVCDIDIRTKDRCNLMKVAEGTAVAGITMMSARSKACRIIKAPPKIQLLSAVAPDPAVKLEIDYKGMPSIAIGDTKNVAIIVDNETSRTIKGKVNVTGPEGWIVECSMEKITVPVRSKRSIPITITVPASSKEIYQIKQWMKTYNIGIQSIGRWRAGRLDENGNYVSEEFEICKQLINVASELGCSIFVCGCNYVKKLSYMDNLKKAVDWFSSVIEYARPLGIRVAVYNCRWNNYIVDDITWRSVLGQLPELGIKYDPSYCIYAGGDYLVEIRDWAVRFYHFHVKGSLVIGGKRFDTHPPRWI